MRQILCHWRALSSVVSGICADSCRPGGPAGGPEADAAPGWPGGRGSLAGAGVRVLAGRPYLAGQQAQRMQCAATGWNRITVRLTLAAVVPIN